MARWDWVLPVVFGVCCGASGQQMAITFDDLPVHGEMPAGMTRLEIASSVLATLKAEQMPAVYGFINGVKVKKDPSTLAVLKAWRAAGDPLGSHTYSHPSLNDLTAEQFEKEIADNEPLLKELMADQDWHWFRYPFLWEGDTLEKRHAVRSFLTAHGYKVAQVSMDFEDYLWNDPYARCVNAGNREAIASLEQSYLATADQYAGLYRSLSQTLYGRDIPYVLLMHIGAFDAHMLPKLIAMYRQKGYAFVTLPEAEKDAAYAMDPDMPLKYGGALQEQMMAARKLKIPPNSKPYKELEAMCR